MQEEFQQGGTGLSGVNRGFQNWDIVRTGNFKCNFSFHVASLFPFSPSLKTSYFLSLKELLPLFLFLSLSVKFSVSDHGSCIISLYCFSLLCTIYLTFISLSSLLVLATWYHSVLMLILSH